MSYMSAKICWNTPEVLDLCPSGHSPSKLVLRSTLVGRTTRIHTVVCKENAVSSVPCKCYKATWQTVFFQEVMHPLRVALVFQSFEADHGCNDSRHTRRRSRSLRTSPLFIRISPMRCPNRLPRRPKEDLRTVVRFLHLLVSLVECANTSECLETIV